MKETKKDNLAIKSIRWIADLMKKGYKVIDVDEMDYGIYKFYLEVPIKYSLLKDIHYLYVDKETGYTVSLVKGKVSFGKFEIYDGELLFEHVERYDTLWEAERRIVELVKSIRSNKEG